MSKCCYNSEARNSDSEAMYILGPLIMSVPLECHLCHCQFNLLSWVRGYTYPYESMYYSKGGGTGGFSPPHF